MSESGQDNPQQLEVATEEATGPPRPLQGVWTVAPGDDRLALSAGLRSLLKLEPSAEGPAGLSVPELGARVPEIERERVQGWLAAALSGEAAGEIHHRLIRGDDVLEVVHTAERIEGRLVGTVRDVSTDDHAVERARFAGHTDALTGLPNRRQFSLALGDAVARARRAEQGLAVLHVDVDGFRTLVDGFGADMADAVLQAVAARLRTVVRTSDTVARGGVGRAVTRVGGNGFLVALADLGGRFEPAVAAERLLGTLRQPFAVGEVEISASVSIGVARLSEDGLEGADLIRHAEVALAHARRMGGDRVVLFRQNLDQEAESRLRKATELLRAVREGQLELVYQPVFHPSSRVCQGVEALVRWRHPQRGLLPPEEFLDVAEDTGIIVSMGDWILAEACIQWRRWLDAGIGPVEVAVNLSGRQLRDPELIPRVARALEISGMDPVFLRLEIPEDVLSPGNIAARDALGRLRALGVGLTIDDFGTRASSLAMLRTVDVDLLKIGRAFVESVPDDQENASLVAAIVALAHKLRFRVVAEGVETEQQLRYLRALDCEGVQGFLLGTPEPAATVAKLLTPGSGSAGVRVVVPFRRRAAS